MSPSSVLRTIVLGVANPMNTRITARAARMRSNSSMMCLFKPPPACSGQLELIAVPTRLLAELRLHRRSGGHTPHHEPALCQRMAIAIDENRDQRSDQRNDVASRRAEESGHAAERVER